MIPSRNDDARENGALSSDLAAGSADIQWLSAFPEEAEVLYPPLTHLAPTGALSKDIAVEEFGITFTVVEVEPSFG